MAAVSLSDEYATDPEIGNDIFSSVQWASGRLFAALLGGPVE